MIDKEKAVAAAEEILAIERNRLTDIQNANAPRVPASLRINGLSALEPRNQAALIREAENSVHKKWTLNALGTAWIASLAIVWYLLSPDQQAFGLLLAMAPALGLLGIRNWLIRRELRRLVSDSSSRTAMSAEA